MYAVSEKNLQKRITVPEALDLLSQADIADLMAQADKIKCMRHGADIHFVHSLNINPTNICKNKCALCAFWRDQDADDAYCLDIQQIRQQLLGVRDLNLKDLHVVGGLTDQVTLEYHLEFFRQAREILPDTVIQGLTAVEIHWFAQQAGKTINETLSALKEAGLDAIPGGGAEIFAQRVRDRICPDKINAHLWLMIHKQAHELGIRSNATMLFGHIETDQEIIDHLKQLRDLQDQTNGFLAFCPLPFHTGGTKLGIKNGPTGHRIARIVALARIFLDNIPHLKAYWPMIGKDMAQLSLSFGVDDIDGTIDDTTKIYSMAGADDKNPKMNTEQIVDLIKKAGRIPVERDTVYNEIKVY
jgi:aminodeoxyfutalosine synthase